MDVRYKNGSFLGLDPLGDRRAAVFGHFCPQNRMSFVIKNKILGGKNDDSFFKGFM